MRHATTTIAAAALVAIGLTGCGDDGPDVEADPRAALLDAFESLGEYDGVELTIGVDGDREAIVAAAEGELDTDTIELLLDSSIVVRAAGDTTEDGRAEFVVDLDGDDVVEMRILPGERAFVRLDLDAIAATVDDPSFTAGLDDALGSARELGFDDVADAALAGEWIELIGFEALAELGGMNTTDEPTEEELEAIRDRIVASLRGFLDENVELTYQGDEDAGERVTATTTLADLMDLGLELGSVAGDLGGATGLDELGLSGEDLGEEGQQPVAIDFWLDGGELSQIGFDLGALADEGQGAPAGTFLLVEIDEFDGTVEAPDDATQLDVMAVFEQLFMGAPGGEPGDGDLPIECIPQEEIDDLIEMDPDAEQEIQEAIDAGFIEVC